MDVLHNFLVHGGMSRWRVGELLETMPQPPTDLSFLQLLALFFEHFLRKSQQQLSATPANFLKLGLSCDHALQLSLEISPRCDAATSILAYLEGNLQKRKRYTLNKT